MINVPTFIKWAGGKQQLLPQFSKYFPDGIQKYVEPFLGGGATFFYVLKYKTPLSARAYDNNYDLVNVYIQVRDHLYELTNELKTLETEHNASNDAKHYYYLKRTLFNTIKRDKLRKAALFIYLNKTCFNGLYRVNAKGEFNVPFNGEKKIKLFDSDVLAAASTLLNLPGVSVNRSDFKRVDINKDELVYFDPPYFPEENSNGFTNYTNSGFNKGMQEELAQIVLRLAGNGTKVILSNSDTRFITTLYDKPNYNKYKIKARRLINCDGKGRDKIVELLITVNLPSLAEHDDYKQESLVLNVI